MRKITKLATRVGNKGTVVKKEPNTPIKVEQKTKISVSKIEQPSPLINILTRTSGRPLGFNRCRASIVNQTYKNIRHLVSFDSLADEEYVKASGAEYFFMDKVAISGELDIADPKTGGAFIYNRYLNHLIEKTESGWVLFLDDDDYLSDNFVIQKIVNCIKSNTDMILWQMKYPHGLVLPSLQELGKPPRMARIGAPCFMVHSGIAKTIKWDGWKCGDFRYIQKAWNKTVDKRVLKEVVVSLGGAGLGKRNDINAKPVNITSVNSGEINGKMIINLLNREKFVEGLKAAPHINYEKNRSGISILITAYKTSQYIEECLNSINNQTFFRENKDYEIIVGIDGCKETYDKAISIKDKYPNLSIIWFKENRGTYITMNSIIPLASYENILRFDSDDVMKPNMVAKLMSVDNVYDLVYFKFSMFNKNITIIDKSKTGPAVGVIFIKKNIYNIAGGYENLRFSGDLELIMRLGLSIKSLILEDQLFFYRRHNATLSMTVNSRDRAIVDDKIRKTKYDIHNVKINPIKNNITSITTSKDFFNELYFFHTKLKNNTPFAIVRYGDGEMDILNNKAADLSQKFNGEHIFNPNDEKYQTLRTDLLNSIQYKSENYYVGLPCPCCVDKLNIEKMVNISGQFDRNLTWANIFVNGNYKYFVEQFLPELKNKEIVLVCNKNANTNNFKSTYNVIKEFRVGANAWLNDYNQIEEIVEYSKILNPNSVLLISAGTFTKILIYKIHQIRQDLFLIDTGSTLDLQLNLGVTRNYLKLNHTNNSKKCLWIK